MCGPTFESDSTHIPNMLQPSTRPILRNYPSIKFKHNRYNLRAENTLVFYSFRAELGSIGLFECVSVSNMNGLVRLIACSLNCFYKIDDLIACLHFILNYFEKIEILLIALPGLIRKFGCFVTRFTSGPTQ